MKLLSSYPIRCLTIAIFFTISGHNANAETKSQCYRFLAGHTPTPSEFKLMNSYDLCGERSLIFDYMRLSKNLPPIKLPIKEAAAIYAYELAVLQLTDSGRGTDRAVSEAYDLYQNIFVINSILLGTTEKKCYPTKIPSFLLSALNANYTENLQTLISAPNIETLIIPDNFTSLKDETAAILMKKVSKSSSLEAVIGAKFLTDLDKVFSWIDIKGKGFLADRPTDGANDIHFNVRATIDCLRPHMLP